MSENLAKINWKIWGGLTLFFLIVIAFSLFFVESYFSIQFSQNEMTIYSSIIFLEAIISIIFASLTVWSYSHSKYASKSIAGEGGSDGGGGGGGVSEGGGGGGGADVTNEIHVKPQIGVPEGNQLDPNDILDELDLTDLIDSEDVENMIETKVEEVLSENGDRQ